MFFNEIEKEKVYVNFVSGVEFGWDYSFCWFCMFFDVVEDKYFFFCFFNVFEIIFVELNLIFYQNEEIIFCFFKQQGNEIEVEKWVVKVKIRSQVMYDVMWNLIFWLYFDYNFIFVL